MSVLNSFRNPNSFKNIVTCATSLVFKRDIFLSQSLHLKEIKEVKINNQLIIEGNIVPAPWEDRLLKTALNTECCAVCSLGVEIKHTDVPLLAQFVRSDGCMLPRRITGLCKTQHKRITYMVAMAQKAGLMSILNPPNSKQDPKMRPKWKKFNTYFDESTIRLPREYRFKPTMRFEKDV
ncbi:large ribosomal subunit protein mL66 [Halyomorpha halys]|uniref:large ribosomal subunit protein mL66 n=1 Tax=Halyomorpha halys TaxID=286706 RepID=UPI0006D505EC|nr:28S ribosomal protein S18a, mitochondrial [Halyomorpha halys]